MTTSINYQLRTDYKEVSGIFGGGGYAIAAGKRQVENAMLAEDLVL